MREVLVMYHHEPEAWWADSPDLPGWSAADPDFAELERLVSDSLATLADPDQPIWHYSLGGKFPAAYAPAAPSRVSTLDPSTVEGRMRVG